MSAWWSLWLPTPNTHTHPTRPITCARECSFFLWELSDWHIITHWSELCGQTGRDHIMLLKCLGRVTPVPKVARNSSITSVTTTFTTHKHIFGAQCLSRAGLALVCHQMCPVFTVCIFQQFYILQCTQRTHYLQQAQDENLKRLTDHFSSSWEATFQRYSFAQVVLQVPKEPWAHVLCVCVCSSRWRSHGRSGAKQTTETWWSSSLPFLLAAMQGTPPNSIELNNHNILFFFQTPI